jgi:hypothetical protein
MPTFAYQASDGTGQEVSGTLEAMDRGAAVKQLSSRGLQPFKVAEAKGGKGEAAAKAKAKTQSAAPTSTEPIKLSGQHLQIFTEENLRSSSWKDAPGKKRRIGVWRSESAIWCAKATRSAVR